MDLILGMGRTGPTPFPLQGRLCITRKGEMQRGRVPNLRNWGVGAKSAWGLVDVRPSLVSGNRPEMMGGHRHLNYTGRVSSITSFSHRPIDSFSHLVVMLNILKTFCFSSLVAFPFSLAFYLAPTHSSQYKGGGVLWHVTSSGAPKAVLCQQRDACAHLC